MRPQAGPVSKPMAFWPSARRIVGLLRAERIAMIAAITLAVLSVALTVSGPKLIGYAVDKIYTGALALQLPAGQDKDGAVAQLRAEGRDSIADMIAKMPVIPGTGIDFGSVGAILAAALAVYLAASLLSYLQGYLLNGAVQRVVYRLRAEVEAKLNRLPLEYFDGQPRGETLSRVTNDIDNVGQSLTQAVSQLLGSLLTIVGVLVMMLIVSPLLTLIAVLVIPAAMVLTGQIMKRSQRHFVDQWTHTGALNAHIEETFSGHELVTVFGRRGEAEAEFATRNEALTDAGYKAQFISGLMMPIMMFVGNLQYVVVCVVGALRVTSGSLTLGEVTAFIQYSRQFSQPIGQLAAMTNLVQSGIASAERVFEVLDAPEQSADAPGRLPAPTKGRVEFVDVDFAYKPDQPLITGLNLTAAPGSTVAIVGPTGAGKSTLVNLLLRFYDVTGGAIRVDGTNIVDVPRAQLRARTAMVLQDTWLFHGTIAENIRYGRLGGPGEPGATDDEVRAAARVTYVDRFVQALPSGYETIIEDDGANLSAGERQLITIARAFLADPAMLILDEATSSVDTRTEVLLQDAMNALRAGRTSFVIAHRLSTIRNADLIVVMESGSIVEQGSHTELIAARGAYYRLYRAQFEGALVAD